MTVVWAVVWSVVALLGAFFGAVAAEVLARFWHARRVARNGYGSLTAPRNLRAIAAELSAQAEQRRASQCRSAAREIERLHLENQRLRADARLREHVQWHRPDPFGDAD